MMKKKMLKIPFRKLLQKKLYDDKSHRGIPARRRLHDGSRAPAAQRRRVWRLGLEKKITAKELRNGGRGPEA